MNDRPNLPASPPFCVGPFTVQKQTLWINGVDAFGESCHMLDVRSWGYLTGQGRALALSPTDAIDAQRATAHWVVDALNVAWQRDQGCSPGACILDAAQPEVGSLWLHVKSGHRYRVIACGMIESNLTPSVIYTGLLTDDDPLSAANWIRPMTEFLDGRFILCD